MVFDHINEQGSKRYSAVTALYSQLRAFADDCRGNIAILFASMMTLLALFAGGAVDYTRWNTIRADMLSSLDAASLAIAQLRSSDSNLTEEELKAYGDAFFRENFKHESSLLPGWFVEFNTSSDAVIGACIFGDLDTILLGVAGIGKLAVDDCVEITPQGAGRVELALVLDVTGSMNCPPGSDTGCNGGSNSKLQALKDSIDTMLNALYKDDETTSDNVRIGIVPFNTFVNPGGASSWSTNYEDTSAQAYYHGSRFFHVTAAGLVDMSRTVNHYDLFDSVDNVTWGGCVESRPYPLDELDVPPGGNLSTSEFDAIFETPDEWDDSGASDEDTLNLAAFTDAPTPHLTEFEIRTANNFNFVPSFIPDGPDCNNGDDCQEDGVFHSSVPLISPYRAFSWHYYYNDPPTGRGWTEDDYTYRFMINDRNYLNPGFTLDHSRYARIIDLYRGVMDGSLSHPDFEDFLRDDLGITQSYSEEFIMRPAYVGYWNPVTQSYDGKYTIGWNSAFSGSPNGDCPPAILPLTNSRTTIENYKNALTANGGTNIPNAAMWGWRVISPGAPFTEAIAPGETGPEGSDFGDWQKAVVIMTDGKNSLKFNGGTPDTHWGSIENSYGYASEERLGEGIDTATKMEAELNNKMLRICQRMKNEDYVVYTVMFGLNDSTTRNVFKACATSSSHPHFHDVGNGADLDDAFNDIADDLVKLHVSK
ncbi:MAG: pilus assembly protein [Pseudomonadota bacterium]